LLDLGFYIHVDEGERDRHARPFFGRILKLVARAVDLRQVLVGIRTCASVRDLHDPGTLCSRSRSDLRRGRRAWVPLINYWFGPILWVNFALGDGIQCRPHEGHVLVLAVIGVHKGLRGRDFIESESRLPPFVTCLLRACRTGLSPASKRIPPRFCPRNLGDNH